MKKINLVMLVMSVFYIVAPMMLSAQTATPPLGSGTSSDPYLVTTLNNLFWITQNNSTWNMVFKQTADIDATTSSSWDGGAGFSPIGNSVTPFTGLYDGQTFKIKGLFINRITKDSIGLFGYVMNSATIINVNLDSIKINGNNYVGGLIGFQTTYTSTASNCYSSGSISGTDYVGGLIGEQYNSTASNCHTSGFVTGANYIGGLIGQQYQSILNNCSSSDSVTSNVQFCGGLTGYHYVSTNNNCYSSGSVNGVDIVGGLIGMENGSAATVTNCYSTGSVKGSGQSVAGLIGQQGNYCIATNCYSSGSVMGANYVGGLVGYQWSGATVINCFWDSSSSGQTSSAGGFGKNTAEMKTPSTFLAMGWSDTIWNIGDGINNRYPYLKWQNPSGTPLDVMSISVDSLISRIGDTVFVPVRASFPFGKTYSALQTKFTGYQGGLHFLGIDTTASLIGTNNWMYSVNGSDTAIVIASAGSTDISGAGVLFKIKFVVIGQSGSFTPINIAQAIFNTGTDAVTIINGGVQIWPVAFYGDVDLNGKVQAFDASVVLKYLIGADTLNYQMLSNADVMNTGVITAFDASIVLQYVVGLIPSLPYDTITMGTAQASGSFVLLDAAAPSVGDTVSMPIQFTNGKNIKSLEATLAYSPSDLDYQNVNWQNGVAGFMTAISVNKINGTVTLIGANAKSTSQSGIMANVYFKVKQQFAQSKVQFKTLRLNASAKQFNLSTANISIITGVKGLETTIPQTYVLNQNYPDPFNPSTTIQYGLPTRSNVRIVIYNMLGQQVKELVNTEQQAGYQSIVWNANVASGMYFYRIVATSLSDPNKRFVETKKMLLLK